MKLALVVMRNEVRELVRNKQLIISISVFPLFVSLVVPLIGVHYADIAAQNPNIAALQGFYGNYIKMFIETAFVPMFLMIPVAIPAAISADSIAGEKERLTMEPLLATPISDVELLAGKALTAFVIAQTLTLTSFLLFLSVSLSSGYVLDVVMWLFIMLLLSPALSMFAILGMTLLSVHAKGVREAQEMGVFVMMPMIAVLVMMVTRSVTLGLMFISSMTAIFLVMDVLLLYAGSKTLGREYLMKNI